MTLALHLIMLAGAAACTCSAVAARHRLEVVASTVMLAAMLDAHITRLVSPLVWLGALMLLGLLLGARLRGSLAAPLPPGAAAAPPLELAHGIAAAAAYPVTAWLIVAHAASTDSAAPLGAAHGGHAATTLAIPTLLAILLTALLAALALAAAVSRRHRVTGAAGGMAAMLAAMLLPA